MTEEQIQSIRDAAFSSEQERSRLIVTSPLAQHCQPLAFMLAFETSVAAGDALRILEHVDDLVSRLVSTTTTDQPWPKATTTENSIHVH